jgi:hypothetical protein
VTPSSGTRDLPLCSQALTITCRQCRIRDSLRSSDSRALQRDNNKGVTEVTPSSVAF